MANLKIQQENIKTLMDLVKENPDLEILPMVDTEVVFSDDYSSWLGSWGSASIDYYYCYDERIYFLSKDREDLIEDYMERIEDEESTETDGFVNEDWLEKEAQKEVDKLPWEKAIVVRIKSA